MFAVINYFHAFLLIQKCSFSVFCFFSNIKSKYYYRINLSIRLGHLFSVAISWQFSLKIIRCLKDVRRNKYTVYYTPISQTESTVKN